MWILNWLRRIFCFHEWGKVTFRCPLCLGALKNQAIKDRDYIAADHYRSLYAALKENGDE